MPGTLGGPASAVVYAGDIAQMRAFYSTCFGLAVRDAGPRFCELTSEAWTVVLVQSAQAVPATSPPPRRADTAVKLAFVVDSIAAVRALAAGLGGAVEPVAAQWRFRDTTRCDALDPEGNVVQLIEPGV